MGTVHAEDEWLPRANPIPVVAKQTGRDANGELPILGMRPVPMPARPAIRSLACCFLVALCTQPSPIAACFDRAQHLHDRVGEPPIAVQTRSDFSIVETSPSKSQLIVAELAQSLAGLWPTSTVLEAEENISGDIESQAPAIRIRRAEYRSAAGSRTCIVTTTAAFQTPELRRDTWDPPRSEFDYADNSFCARATRYEWEPHPRTASFSHAKLDGPESALEGFLGWARGLLGRLPVEGELRVDQLTQSQTRALKVHRNPREGFPCEIALHGGFGTITYTVLKSGDPPVRLQIHQVGEDCSSDGRRLLDDPPPLPVGAQAIFPRVGITENLVDISEVVWDTHLGTTTLVSFALRQTITYRDGRRILIQRNVRLLSETPQSWRPLTDLPEGTGVSCEWAPGLLCEVRSNRVAPRLPVAECASIDRITSALRQPIDTTASRPTALPEPVTRVGSKPGYCGIFAVYACAKLLAHTDASIESLLRPEYVGSSAGSTIAELCAALKSQGLHARVCTGITLDFIAATEPPLILHVRASPRSKVPDHYVVVVGRIGSRLLIIDGQALIELDQDQLPVSWDGTAIVASADELAGITLETRRLWRLGLSIALIALIAGFSKLTSRGARSIRALESRNLSFQALVVIGVATALGLALTGFTGDRLLSNEASAELARRSASPKFVPRISVAGARAQHRAGVPFIDARVPEDYERGHIAGAINIFADVSPNERRAATASLDKSLPIVVYCSSDTCPLAENLAADLYYDGFDQVVVFPGGMTEWSAGDT